MNLQLTLLLTQSILLSLVGFGSGFFLSNHLNDLQPPTECAVPITQPQGVGLEHGAMTGLAALDYWKGLADAE
jgi:hypothetical protein